MSYYGDIAEDATIRVGFNTNAADGTPTTLSGTPAVSVYKQGSTTESTAGVTLTVDYDSRTGYNVVVIDTSADAFYATANDYQVVITTGTVDSVSVVGVVVASFSVENRYMRGTDSANTAAPLDASGVRSAVGLASANLDTQLTGISDKTDNLPGSPAATGDIPSASTIATEVWSESTRTLTAFSFLTAGGIADAVWDESLASHDGAGSAGANLAAAGSAGDPWSTLLPGSYTTGQAGKIVGDYLDATVSSRSTYDGSDTSGVTTLLSRVPDTISLAAINAQVDTALADYDPPTATEMTAAFTEIKGAGWDSSTDTLEDIAAWAGSGGLTAEDVWTYATRTLTAIDATIISGNISGTVGGINGVAFPVNFDLLAIDANGVVDATLDSTEHDDIAVAFLDLTDGVESGVTVRQSLRLSNSAGGGKLSGAATSWIVIRDVNDTKDRVTATVDADGNRSAVTLDLD